MWGKTQQVAGYTDLTHLTVQGKLCVKVIVYVNKTIYLSCKILPQLQKSSHYFLHIISQLIPVLSFSGHPPNVF